MNPVEIKDLPGLVGTEVGVSDWVQIDQDRGAVRQFVDPVQVDLDPPPPGDGGQVDHRVGAPAQRHDPGPETR